MEQSYRMPTKQEKLFLIPCLWHLKTKLNPLLAKIPTCTHSYECITFYGKHFSTYIYMLLNYMSVIRLEPFYWCQGSVLKSGLDIRVGF